MSTFVWLDPGISPSQKVREWEANVANAEASVAEARARHEAALLVVTKAHQAVAEAQENCPTTVMHVGGQEPVRVFFAGATPGHQAFAQAQGQGDSPAWVLQQAYDAHGAAVGVAKLAEGDIQRANEYRDACLRELNHWRAFPQVGG